FLERLWRRSAHSDGSGRNPLSQTVRSTRPGHSRTPADGAADRWSGRHLAEARGNERCRRASESGAAGVESSEAEWSLAGNDRSAADRIAHNTINNFRYK